jgi:hypothetical protein
LTLLPTDPGQSPHIHTPYSSPGAISLPLFLFNLVGTWEQDFRSLIWPSWQCLCHKWVLAVWESRTRCIPFCLPSPASPLYTLHREPKHKQGFIFTVGNVHSSKSQRTL